MGIKIDGKFFKGIIIILWLLVFSTGCATVEETSFPAGLPGMIYDNYNNPVDGARIQLDIDSNKNTENPEVILTSDIDGRFLIPPMDPGEYDISIYKAGYESGEVRFEFTDPKQVLYIKLTSLRYLRNEIEERLMERDFRAAGRLIRRASEAGPRDPVLIYLRAVYHYLIEEFDTALLLQEELETLGMENPGLDFLKEDTALKILSPEGTGNEE